MPNPNAVKGHNWERKIINDIKKFWSWAKSSRATSKRLDNCKIDINDIPVLIQAKATQLRPNYQVLWEDSMRLIDEQFPPDEAKKLKQYPFIVMHKDTTRKSGKNKPYTETMTFDYTTGLLVLELYAKHLKDIK